MIRLTDLAGNGSFNMGGTKIEYGKVYSNPYVTAFKSVNEAEGSEDHEVSMAQNQLDSIIKHATELKQKMGEEEKQIPAWIQDHIKTRKEVVSEAGPCWKGYKQVGMKDKGGKQVPNCVPESVVNEARSIGQVQKDFTKVIQAIASELEKYKSVKGTPKAKQYIANLKKLGAAKEKLEAEMDYVVSNIYVDAELQEGCGCK